MAVLVRGVGSGFKWPWEKTAKDYEKELESTAIFPGVGGLFGAKTVIVQKGAKLLPIAGGALAGFLLGQFGGGKQEIKPTQTTTTQPVQAPEQTVAPYMPVHNTLRDFMAKMRAAQTAKTDIPITTPVITTPQYHISGSTGVDIGGTTTQTYTMPYTSTQQGLSMEAIGQFTQPIIQALQQPQQITLVMPEQKVAATQETGLSPLLIIGALIAGIYFMTRKKGG